MSKRDWTPIEEQTAAAQQLGHALLPFAHPRRNGSFKMAACNACGGCCWVSYTPTRGFGMGGRLLKFRCGDVRAAGLSL